MKPCITTCPAIVPMLEDERPEASSATPKSTSALESEVRTESLVDLREVVADINEALLVERRGGDDRACSC